MKTKDHRFEVRRKQSRVQIFKSAPGLGVETGAISFTVGFNVITKLPQFTRPRSNNSSECITRLNIIGQDSLARLITGGPPVERRTDADGREKPAPIN